MHDLQTRRLALGLLADGLTRAEVCRRLGVSRQSTLRWQNRLAPRTPNGAIRCFRCAGIAVADPYSYNYLLGQYLGDGHIARSGRSTALRIYCCDDYPRIMSEVAVAMRAVSGTSVNFRHIKGSRCTQVQSATNHWKCLFPQHGPGMKHTRPILLTDWQREIVALRPQGLIRGLIHSDGCRATNIVHRPLPSGIRTYTYPRYFFKNESTDIRGIFTDTLDSMGVAWKQNQRNCISVARKEAVEALDAFIGPKT